MNSLTPLLREADPLQYEGNVFASAAPLIRQRVVAAETSARTGTVGWRRLGPVAAFGAVLFIVLAGLFYGPLWWSRSVIAQVRFEVRLAEDRPVPGLIVAQVGRTDRTVYLHPEIVVGNADVARAWVVDHGTQAEVSVQLRPDGAERLRQATTMHVGRPVAILVDGQVVMAPVVRSPISDAAQISGNYTREQADRIAAGMTAR